MTRLHIVCIIDYMEFTADNHPARCLAADNLDDLCTDCITEYTEWCDERAAEYASA